MTAGLLKSGNRSKPSSQETADFAAIVLSKTCDVGRDHLIHRKRSPFPYEGKALMRRKGSETSTLRRAKRCREARPRAGAPIHERRRGEAHRRQGWVGGVYPSAQLKARTAAFGGHTASTRAARSAGLRFASDSTVGSIGQGKSRARHCKSSPT